jgi:chemotaxis protein methyltransferase CheR
MTDLTSGIDLSALSSKLRQDDRDFRRTFALGQLADGERRLLPLSDGPADDGDLRARLVALIEAKTGIDASQGGGSGDRLNRLLATLPAASLPSWVLALDAEPIESPSWEALISSLTVQETYFFRDPDQLRFLRREVLAPLIAAQQKERIARLSCWCAGCATGEEAYSLAILIVEALREAGEADLRPDGSIVIHPRWRISVLGTDIDPMALRHARTGCYLDFAMGPFRSLPSAFSGYFEPTTDDARRPGRPSHRQVHPDIRALCHFLPFNLAHHEPPVLDADTVLCRNVLIYLSDRVRSHAQGLFHRALNQSGHLALGPTDTVKVPSLFLPLWGPDTVLYRKR